MTENRTEINELIVRHDERIEGLSKTVDSIDAELRRLRQEIHSTREGLRDEVKQLRKELNQERQMAKGHSLTTISIVVGGVTVVVSVIVTWLIKALG